MTVVKTKLESNSTLLNINPRNGLDSGNAEYLVFVYRQESTTSDDSNGIYSYDLFDLRL